MKYRVIADGRIEIAGRLARCAVGRGGIIPSSDKREGDGATPAGFWPLRQVWFRADRLRPPPTDLPIRPIAPTDGWCDAPADPNYNRAVSLPYAAAAESLWRADRLYDLLIVLGYNDRPPRPGAGSAIFVHRVRPDFAPTEGCVALRLPDLRRLIALARPGDGLMIEATPSG